MTAKEKPTAEANAKPNRGGAPAGNANRTRSGKRAWSAVKRLPAGCGAIRQQLYCERDEIEGAVVRQHGEISLLHAAIIQSAWRHSGRAQLLERWLRTEATLSLTERLAVLREIGNATDSRDKCLAKLGLEAKPESDPLAAWPTFDATPTGDPEDASPEAPAAAAEAIRPDLADPMAAGPGAVEGGSPDNEA